MSYVLGVDLGTTYTAAAVCRREAGGWGPAEVLPLGTRSAAVASVLYFGSDATVLVGEAAERRALVDPAGVAREFKRRIGDRTPLLLSGRQHTAHELAARLARWVVDRATEREGGAPDRVAVTHPAGWGEHKKGLLLAALADVGLGEAALSTEPEAAAFDYSAVERVGAGTTIAVYDLGGGTFDAAVLRKVDDSRFELLGDPAGADRLGGIDFDEAVFDHLRTALPGDFAALALDDPVAMAAVTRLRRECTEAKEALSGDTEVTIPVLLPGGHAQTRLVRGEFEAMIRPALDETVALLRASIRSAGLAESDVDRVLLVGGSSRIPLVSQLLSQEFGRPVAVDSDPKSVVARGAARAVVPAGPHTTAVERTDEVDDEVDDVPADVPARPKVADIPLVLPRPARRRRLLRPRVLAGAAALAVVAMSAASTVASDEPIATGTAATTPDNPVVPPDDAAVPDQAEPAAEPAYPQVQPVAQRSTPPPNRKARPSPNVPDAGLNDTDAAPAPVPALARASTGTADPTRPSASPATTSSPAAPAPLQAAAVPTPDYHPPAADSLPPATATSAENPPPPAETPPPPAETEPPTTEAPPPTTEAPPQTTDDPPPTTDDPPPATTTEPTTTTEDPVPTT
ncbi:Hsp70 family protein [Actinosynnema sp. NPDC047251]|uniref:Heat shock protein 70 n=1 Tax=Saccharothrix espanaensis (strain ATCC 51144 / DSM 44229 / JCM 9112 / NBRC 15066 / NRRL 15764) TaxID=1179773 RepID=K0JWG0_SACES|nr:Hsp70 family protein [Saccharothrix espanaensis]CCH32155.1 hypothetical protein BN6_48830 [Saccharothrix espanaensis DSM 44229]